MLVRNISCLTFQMSPVIIICRYDPNSDTESGADEIEKYYEMTESIYGWE